MNKLLISITILLFFNACSIKLKNFPEPTGRYKIGTDTFVFEDRSRLEWFTEKEDDYRTIAVQMWYPSENVSDSLFPYIDHKIKMEHIAEQLNVSTKMLSGLEKVKTNSYFQSPIINKEFPVILFSHGLGGTKTQNSINIENLVSNGYIVIAVDHSYDALVTVLNDNIADFRSDPGWNTEVDEVTEEEFWNVRLPQINTRAKDISYLIDKLYELKNQKFYIAKSCDLGRIGIFGHSFGGGTGIVSSFSDNRISSCLNLDGWLEPVPDEIINSGIKIPFCYIGQVQENWTSAKFNKERINRFHNNNTHSSYIFEIENSKHLDYIDMPYLFKLAKLFGFSGKAGKTLTIDLNAFILGFFDENLKNKKSNWIEIMEENYNASFISN